MLERPPTDLIRRNRSRRVGTQQLGFYLGLKEKTVHSPRFWRILRSFVMEESMKQPLVVLTLVAAGSLSAAMVFSPRIQAQTTVESTATPEKPVQLAASPMKLTIKLGRLEAALVNKPIEFTDMSNYKCEGVVINNGGSAWTPGCFDRNNHRPWPRQGRIR